MASGMPRQKGGQLAGKVGPFRGPPGRASAARMSSSAGARQGRRGCAEMICRDVQKAHVVHFRESGSHSCGLFAVDVVLDGDGRDCRYGSTTDSPAASRPAGRRNRVILLLVGPPPGLFYFILYICSTLSRISPASPCAVFLVDCRAAPSNPDRRPSSLTQRNNVHPSFLLPFHPSILPSFHPPCHPSILMSSLTHRPPLVYCALQPTWTTPSRPRSTSSPSTAGASSSTSPSCARSASTRLADSSP